MPRLTSDQDLRARQSSLQEEAGEVLTELHRAGLFDEVGPPLPAGSYVSGLMCWRDLDVMVLGGSDFSPADVLRLLARAVDIPDERYHVTIALRRGSATWQIDLSVWLHDPHANVTAWHEALRDSITDEQRDAVLRIKDVWHRLPGYPDDVGGPQIYTAVLDHGVRTPEQFAAWLAEGGPAHPPQIRTAGQAGAAREGEMQA